MTTPVNNPPVQPTAPKKQSIKIGEFQWYEVENKVRQYMHDLLQPFQRKQVQQSARMAQMKRELGSFKQKLSEHAFLLKLTNDKPIPFIEMQNRITGVEENFTKLQLEQRQNIQQIQNKLLFYDEKIHKIDIVSQISQKQRQNRLNDKQQFLKRIDEQVSRLTKAIESQNNDFNVLNSTFRTSIHELEQRHQVSENRIKNFDQTAKSLMRQIDILRDDLLKTDKKINQNKFWLGDLQKRMDKLEDNNELSRKFIAVVEDLKTQFAFVQAYLDRYLPIFVQAQISDTLNSFVSGNNRKALCLYEQRIFQHYSMKVLTNEAALGLDDNIKNYIELIERILLRNRKYVIKLKVERRVKLGSKEYDVHILDTGLDEEDDASKKVQVEMVVPNEKVKELVDNHWKQISLSLVKKVDEGEKNAKTWLKEMQEYVDHRGMMTDGKIQKIEEHLQKHKIQIDLQLSGLKTEMDETIMKMQNLANLSQDSRHLLRELTHFCSIINHIIIQDEIDRQGIALYGLKDTQKQREKEPMAARQGAPNINLDPKCFGCSGFPASTLSAFKMACLAYNPSNVLVEGKAYRREEILQFGTKLLQGVKERMVLEPTLKQQFGGRHTSLSYTQNKTIDTPRSRMLPSVSRSNSRDAGPRKELLFRKKQKSQTIKDPLRSFYL